MEGKCDGIFDFIRDRMRKCLVRRHETSAQGQANRSRESGPASVHRTTSSFPIPSLFLATILASSSHQYPKTCSKKFRFFRSLTMPALASSIKFKPIAVFLPYTLSETSQFRVRFRHGKRSFLPSLSLDHVHLSFVCAVYSRLSPSRRRLSASRNSLWHSYG